ncbi:hypothetical protein D3C77_489600 [compost metagenome]
MAGVTQQVGDAEVHPATAAEHFLANRSFMAVGVVAGIAFGKVDADLHRSTGTHRVQVTQQSAPHRQAANQVIENRAELFFTAHGIKPFTVGFAVG